MAVEYNGGNYVLEVYERSGHIAVSSDNFMLIWGGYMEHEIDGERYLPSKEINIYDKELKYWTSHSTTGAVPPGTSGAAGFLINGHLYVFAGHTQHGNSNSLYCLDLTSLTWVQLSPTWKAGDQKVTDQDASKACPSPRDKFCSWAYENKLYAFGGFGVPTRNYLNDNGAYQTDGSTPWVSERGWNNQLVVYDIQTNVWDNPRCKGIPPLPRAAHAAAKFEKSVYIFGGRHCDRRLNDLHRLDLETNTWSGEIYVDGACPCGRSWHSFTRVSDHVAFLYGGYSEDRTPLSDGWQLNINTRQWSQLTLSSDRPRLWHTCCCSNDGELLIFGGCSNDILDYGESTLHSNEVLCVQLQPAKLLRLCLESAYTYSKHTQSDWPLLPSTLRDWLNKKQRIEEQKKQSHKERSDQRLGSTCIVS